MKSFLLPVLLVIVLGFSNCKKQGCTDPDAINYDPASNDKCCCEYYVTNLVIFSINGAHGNIGVTVDGKSFDSLRTTFSINDTVSCGTDGTITLDVIPGNHRIVARGQDGYKWNKVVNCVTGDCRKVILK